MFIRQWYVKLWGNTATEKLCLAIRCVLGLTFFCAKLVRNTNRFNYVIMCYAKLLAGSNEWLICCNWLFAKIPWISSFPVLALFTYLLQRRPQNISQLLSHIISVWQHCRNRPTKPTSFSKTAGDKAVCVSAWDWQSCVHVQYPWMAHFEFYD